MKSITRIMDIARAKQLADFDTVFMICGAEGSSKSHLGLNCLEYLGGIQDKICLDQQDFIDGLKKCQDNDVIMFDEAGDGLFSRDFNSNTSKTLVKTFMVIRGKKLITFLIMPSFFLIDKYFREHRVRGLFYVYARGRVAFYDKNKIMKIIKYGEKSGTIPRSVRPLFRDTYPIYKGSMIDEYKEKKRIKIQDTLDAMGKKEAKQGSKTLEIQQWILKGAKVKDIATMMKCHVSYVSHIKGMMKNEIEHRQTAYKVMKEEETNDKVAF